MAARLAATPLVEAPVLDETAAAVEKLGEPGEGSSTTPRWLVPPPCGGGY